MNIESTGIGKCGCGSHTPTQKLGGSPITSWIELTRAMPANPLDLVAFAALNATNGLVADSTTYNGSGTWAASPVTVSVIPTIQSLATDEAVTSAYAEQWTLSHLTANLGATVAPPLQKILYLKAGRSWLNKVVIQLGGTSYSDFQLSFRDNAATRGDAAGTVPVISFAVSTAGAVTLDLTLHRPAIAFMGLVMKNTSSGDWSMLEMEWRIMP